jgi:acetyl-CoA C-acetyltransferase
VEKSVIVGSAIRTPLGKRNGALSQVHPARVLGPIQRAALDRAAVEPVEVDQVIGGAVAQVGEQSFNVARTAWLAEGLPASVAATTVDAQCGSSQQAFTLAVGLVGSGLSDVVLACGVESMSRLPIGSNFRKDFDLGRPVPKAYRDHYEFLNQFQAAERIAQRYGVTRDQADELGLESQRRAAAGWQAGRFDAQLETGPFRTEDGAEITFAKDEGLRLSDREALRNLDAVLPGGIHTPASASQISDGASAVLVMSEERAARCGINPLARVVDSLLVGVDPVMMLLGPHAAVPALLERNALGVDDIDIFEINEAFASVVLSFQAETKADPAKINPNGGAIAMGHPLGATGGVLIAKAAHELARTGSRYAVVSMCCGGGLGTATLLERF